MTFAARSEAESSTALEPARYERLRTYQTEIAQATKELADGLMQRGQFMPDLEEALRSMNSAVAELQSQRLATAVEAEQTALQHLLRTRKNMRQMLSQSQSQSASECRKFDRQQRQKLRTPEQKEKDRQQELAQARQELEQIAQQQRQWSEELRQSQSQSQSQSKSPSPSSEKNPEQNPDKSSEKPASPSPAESSSGKRSSSGSESSGSPKSSQELAAAQEKMLESLEEVRRKLESNGGSTPAAQEAVEAAQAAMGKSLEELAAEEAKSAEQSSRAAAEQLDRLREHLGALGVKDFGERLERTHRLAEQLAARQADVVRQVRPGEPTPAKPDAASGDQSGAKPGETSGDQAGAKPGEKPGASASGSSGGGAASDDRSAARAERRLAVETRMLNELLSGLRAEGGSDRTGAVRELEELARENGPAEIADQLQAAADDLEAGRRRPALANAEGAERGLQELAQGLKGVRGRFAQPQLEELIELERRLAELQDQAARADAGARTEQLAAEWAPLEARLDRLATGDGRLAEALERLRSGGESTSTEKPAGKPAGKPTSEAGESAGRPGGDGAVRPGGGTQPAGETPPGLYWLKPAPGGGPLKEVAKALQVKIQEAILAAAMQDSDESVPPEYKPLVDDYYKALSDDLR